MSGNMQSQITTRHFKLTDDLAEYVDAKIARAMRYCDDTIGTQVILTQEKYRYIAEILINVPRGKRLRAIDEAGDMHAAVDAAVLRVEAQLRRFKDRMRGHPKGRKAILAKRLERTR